MVVTQRRNTTQRAAILQVLAGTDEFVSAQELHSALRTSGSTIGLATVYRALQDMAGGGDLDTVRNQTGEVLYRQCEQPRHHHHLVCRQCGRTQEIEAPSVETLGPDRGGRVRLHRHQPRTRAVRGVRRLHRRPRRLADG